MTKFIVTVPRLNIRRTIPAKLPDDSQIAGIVYQNFIFEGEEVTNVPNAALGKWYKDANNYYYWGGGVHAFGSAAANAATPAATPANGQAQPVAVKTAAATVLPKPPVPADEPPAVKPVTTTVAAATATLPAVQPPSGNRIKNVFITPAVQKKVEQVVNVFETGSTAGEYGELVCYRDYHDPATNDLLIQVTYGRSQTTEFSHLAKLVADYVQNRGQYADTLKPYVGRIGHLPSLSNDPVFCDTLKQAGKDPVMIACQDKLFDSEYYQPAYQWFNDQGFTLPLSLLVIYDSFVHSGQVRDDLREKVPVALPAAGGKEKDWIAGYVDVRQFWLANHSNTLLRLTVYRMVCMKEQIKKDNWSLAAPINANGVTVS